MNQTLHHLFSASLKLERAKAAKGDALFELAHAVKHSGQTLAEMGARLTERWNSDQEARDWHLEQIATSLMSAEAAVNAYRLLLLAAQEAAS